MKKSFMTRVLAVSLSAAMAFSLPSANLLTASAATTVSIDKTATVKVGNTKTLKLKKNNSDWKITKVATNKKKVCTAKKKSNKAFTITGVKKGTATISVTINSPKRKAANKAKSKWQKVLKTKVTVKKNNTTPTTPTTPTAPTTATDPTNATTPTGATTPTDPTGATTPSGPVGELALTTIRSLARTTVEVVFNQKVDKVSKENFKVTEDVAEGATAGTVTVEDAILSENGLIATLTLGNEAALMKDYKLEVSGLTCSGAAQGTLEGKFKSLSTQDEYVAVMETDKTVLNANNSDNANITFKIYEGATGKLRTDVNNIDVEFTTTYGSVAAKSVVVRNGVAEVMFSSQNLTSNVTAVITGTVKSAGTEHGDINGLRATTSILLALNAADINTAQGVTLTQINAITADRIIAYFNKEVKPDDFVNTTGGINADRAEVEVKDEIGLRDKTVPVKTILPVADNSKALQILLEKPLVDNSEISLKFTDKRYSVHTSNTAYDRLVDATQPAVYNVETVGLRQIKVTFSEAVLTDEVIKSVSGYLPSDLEMSAENLDNYKINGRKLTDFGNSPKVEVSKDADKRNIATITFGTQSNGKPVYLEPNTFYALQVSGVGDWAAMTDKTLNLVHTQTFYFNVKENVDEPSATVEVQSPEQFLVKFNGEVARTSDNKKLGDLKNDELANVMQLRMYNDKTKNYESIGEKISVRKRPSAANEYYVEMTEDWTVFFNTAVTGDNYFKNHQFELYMPKNEVYNYDNGKENSKDLALSLTHTSTTGSEKLLTEDVTSPEAIGAEKIGDWVFVEFDEPIQLGNDKTNTPIKVTDRTFTPSQNQQNAGYIQSTTARFINEATKEQIDGTVDNWLYEDDKFIRIQADKKLTAGTWNLTVTGVSDDVGNTMRSKTFQIKVDGNVASDGLHIVWAAVSDVPNYEDFRKGKEAETTADKGRYVFIKFSEAVGYGTSLSASPLVNSNYTINGKEVPGTATVYGYIDGYSAAKTNVCDSVTIDLKQGNNFNLDETRQAAIVVAGSITSADGNRKLGDTGRITAPWKYGTNDSKVTAKTSRYDRVDASNDDVWGNHDSEYIGGAWSKFQEALKDEKYRTVRIPDALTSGYTIPDKNTLSITRPVELDLNGKTLHLDTGMTINYEDTGIVKIVNTDKNTQGQITCQQNPAGSANKYKAVITVNTPNTDMNLGYDKTTDVYTDKNNTLKVENIKINDLLKDTFTNYKAEIDLLSVADNGGTGIVNKVDGVINKVEIDAVAKFTLQNYAADGIKSVYVKRANTIEVKGDTDTKPIGGITSDDKNAVLTLNVPSGKEADDLVTGCTGFNKVQSTTGKDLTTNAQNLSKDLAAELNKLATTTISGSALNSTIDIIEAIGDETTGKTPLLTSINGKAVTYKVTVKSSNQAAYLNVGDAHDIKITENGASLSGTTNIAVTVEAEYEPEAGKKVRLQKDVTLIIKK